MNRLRNIWREIKPRGGWRYPAIIITGAFVGLFIYTFFASRAYSYLSDDPSACVNCHIMSPYYATWMHSSHGGNTTCNDCHVPHNNIVNKYYFKAKDGLRHAAVFTLRGEKGATENRAEMMAGTAYGELLQSKSFFDEKEDYYIACNTVIPGAPSTTQQFGALARIKKDATDFDKTYLGYRTSSGGKGKIITAEYLTSGKALLYIMDPEYTGAPGWGATGANCYYAILDLNTDKLERLPLPHSKGNFSQRSIVLGNKAYIGVNPEKAAPLIYIYDIPTGNLTKGKPIKTGYSFERIVALMD
ncbi:NapC/NirT family cytochrome c [Limibacterium fermenti]